MSNHSSMPPGEMSETFAKMIRDATNGVPTVGAEKEAILKQHLNDSLGDTGRFPEGKLNDRDEGEIAFAVGVEQGKVALSFGKPVAWIAFTPEQAMEIARLIRNKAKRLQRSEFA